MSGYKQQFLYDDGTNYSFDGGDDRYRGFYVGSIPEWFDTRQRLEVPFVLFFHPMFNDNDLEIMICQND